MSDNPILKLPLMKDESGNPIISHLKPGRDFICDQEFNVGRTIDPKDSEGNVDSLIGTVGEDSALGEIHSNVVLRAASQEERARWLEIHSADEYLAGVAEDQRASYCPQWVVADGFGRCEAHIAEFGNEKPMAVNFLEGAINNNQAIIYGVTRNKTNRGVHFLDEYRAMLAAKAEGYRQNAVAKLLNCSPAKVSIIVKVCGKLTDDDKKKIVKKGLSFQQVERDIKKRFPDLFKKKDEDKDGSDDGGSKIPPPKALSAGKRNKYVSAIDRALSEVSDGGEEYKVLQMAQFTMQFVGGEYGDKTFLQAAQDCGLLEGFEFDFEHDPESAPPPPPAPVTGTAADAPSAPPAAPTVPAAPTAPASKKKAKKKASKKTATNKVPAAPAAPAADGKSGKKVGKKKAKKKAASK